MARELVKQINAVNSIVNKNTVSVMPAGETVNTQNVTFNQYNTSPKALSRLELYQQTNNLLFSAKVRMGNV